VVSKGQVHGSILMIGVTRLKRGHLLCRTQTKSGGLEEFELGWGVLDMHATSDGRIEEDPQKIEIEIDP